MVKSNLDCRWSFEPTDDPDRDNVCNFPLFIVIEDDLVITLERT
jgi:hypothetical protein